MNLQTENILIVDDDLNILELLQRHLKSFNYHVYKAISVKEALLILKDTEVDLLITDLNMPEVNGIELIKYTSEHFPKIPKLVVTGYPSVDGALEAMRSGVIEYLIKPFTKDELHKVVLKAISNNNQSNYASSNKISHDFEGLIGNSDAIQKVKEVIHRVKDNKATIFILGESGTGKEVVARAIHYGGKFSSAPFIAVNCGAIPENLLESELFGYVKGAFTGANENRSGYFQAANKGTIFLDEIGNASLSTQLRLLRVLQEKEVIRVGSQKVEKVDVRIIAATNIDLKELIKKGKFREDLYYRLTVVEIDVPPLRERLSDIPLLVDKFLFKYGVEYKDRLLKITDEALAILKRYSYPGNIRELENIIQRAVIMSDRQIDVPNLPNHVKYTINFPKKDSLLSLKEVEKNYIQETLKRTDNNKTKAAEILQIDRKTLQNKIKLYNL